MAFPDIFNFGRSTATGGSKAEKILSEFIPTEENESISIPPHDPFKPQKPVRQDPKIVRETSPQGGIIFNFISSTVTSDMKQSSDDVEKSMSDPSSVVDPAAGVMGKAGETSDKVKDDCPTPNDLLIPPPPQPKDVKPKL
ncbi:hypothetical protein [Chryseobacterium sp.]|uniref:hypothetical protein n=1 Tax=Chryseobacterium sp. TaxID=1871047 RepID=UPI0025B85B57|nr:hypothetical protein [Chryseobacterium sp.]